MEPGAWCWVVVVAQLRCSASRADENAPVVGSIGLLVWGHKRSSAIAGSVRGKHIGKPVEEAMVGLSWSTMNRPSGDMARP